MPCRFVFILHTRQAPQDQRRPSMLRVLFDPTVLFIFGCLVTPVGLVITNLHPDHPRDPLDATVRYLLDPALLAGVGALLLGLALGGVWKNYMKDSNRMLALWFLLNGAFIHITMDGSLHTSSSMTGGWHFLPLLDTLYRKIDKRFDEDEATSWIITQVELWIMAPLCIFTYWAFAQNSTTKYLLAIITSILQLFGAVLFFGCEVYNDFPNTPVDRDLKFTPHDILYFWFAFGANLIWIIVPLVIIFVSYFKVQRQIGKSKID